MAVISVSLPDALLEQADDFIGARGFAGRSDLVRAAIRDFLGREAGGATGGSARSATLTLLYPEGSERKLADIRHEFTDIIRSMMHAHARDMCVEVFVLEGSGRRIQQFADALRAARETRLVQSTWTDSAPESGPAHAGHRH